MKLPNKITPYNDSIINKFPFILDQLKVRPMSVIELYYIYRDQFRNVTDFFDTLDCLFALGKIIYNKDRRMITYVSGNIL